MPRAMGDGRCCILIRSCLLYGNQAATARRTVAGQTKTGVLGLHRGLDKRGHNDLTSPVVSHRRTMDGSRQSRCKQECPQHTDGCEPGKKHVTGGTVLHSMRFVRFHYRRISPPCTPYVLIFLTIICISEFTGHEANQLFLPGNGIAFALTFPSPITCSNTGCLL
jgi:hypothetical protein